jgi:hypothetical protein
MYRRLSLGLAATAIGITGATGLQCSGEVKARVMTSFAQFGPKGTAAENNADPSGTMTSAVTLSVSGTCWAVGRIFISGWAGPRGLQLLPGRPKTLASAKGASDARSMQKRATLARSGQGPRDRRGYLIGLSLGLAATAIGITGATGLQCSGEVKARVMTSFAQFGPKGTAAENNAECRTGWVHRQGPGTHGL